MTCCAALVALLALAGCGSSAIIDFEPTVYEGANRPSKEARQSAALSDSVLQAARSAAAQGHAGAAESLYWRTATLAPENPDVYAELGALLLRSDASEKAAAAYQAAIRLDPENAAAHYGLGRAQILLDQPQAAADSFAAANAVTPTVRGYNGLGVALDMTGAHAAAQTAYAQGLGLDPENLGLRNNLGLSQILAGRHEEAVATLRRAASHPLATPRERQNLALALGLSENPRLAARIGRLDLTDEQVADNLVFYQRLRQGPDTGTLTALRQDRGGLAPESAPQIADTAAAPTESASIVPLGRVTRPGPAPAKPAASTPSASPADRAPSPAPSFQDRQPDVFVATPNAPTRATRSAVQTERASPVRVLPDDARRTGSRPVPVRDAHPSIATGDIALPMQVGEPGIGRGSPRGDKPHPARGSSVWTTPPDRTKPGQGLVLRAEIAPDTRPTFLASNAPARALSTAVWPDGISDRTFAWGIALGLLIASLIALNLIVSKQIREAGPIGKAPGRRSEITPTAGSAPANLGATGSVCGDEEVALIDALLAGEGPLIEQAQRCRRLMEDFGYGVAVLAQLLGKSPGHVASMARLAGWQERITGAHPGSASPSESPPELEPPPIAPLPGPAS